MLTAGFQSVAPVTSRAFPSLFILTFSVWKSLQCLISALTQGDEGGHLFRFTYSVVLWEGRDTANKYNWCVCGVLTVYGPHWVCHTSRWHVLPGSILLRLQGALQGHVPMWALHFVPLIRSKPLRFSGTPQVLLPSQVQAAQVIRCLVSALSKVGRAS